MRRALFARNKTIEAGFDCVAPFAGVAIIAVTQAGNQKFIAAEPANNLILRLLVSQPLADLYKEAIARLMTVLVIDSLEIIEVNKGHHDVAVKMARQ